MEELINKLSEEEKKAIEELKGCIMFWQGQLISTDEKSEIEMAEKEIAINKTLLNIIKKQQEQLQEKDKIIDLMAEMITGAKFCYFKKEEGSGLLGKYRCYNKDEWIEYFTKKARKV